MAGEDGPDLALENLPGMGLIRARSIRKAGWDNIASLRKATVAELAAVPGISERKAQEIVNLLAQTAEKLAPRKRGTTARKAQDIVEQIAQAAEKPAPRKRRTAAAKTPKAPAQEWEIVEDRPAPSDLREEGLRVTAIASALLGSGQASRFGGQLTRQIARISEAAERAGAEDDLSPVEREFARLQLVRACDLLEAIAEEPRIGGKHRDRFAESLRDRRQRLEAALPEPIRTNGKKRK